MNKAIRNYLAAYNFVAFLFWMVFLLSYLVSGLQLNGPNLWLLNIAQGMAVLEILHALVKWVKSPLLTTIAQVLSRLLVLALIDIYVLHLYTSLPAHAVTMLNAGVVIALLAWSVTEIVRYALYFLALFNRQPALLLWIRYSFFIVLYPLGITGEWLIFIFLLVPTGIGANQNTAFIIALFAAYAYSFPALYKYMWAQRKVKLKLRRLE